MSDCMLQIEAADLRYGSKRVVNAASLIVQRGQWIALVGPNASGKTTLLRCAAGRLPPARGMVRMDGSPLYPVDAWKGELPGFAAAPEELPPFLSVQQSLAIYANAHGLADVPAATLTLCRELGLGPHEHELVRHLSLGTRQKLAVVLALLTAPRLLLLDEVFNGLDIRSALVLKTHLRRQVAEQGLTIVLATHALDVVKDYCDGLVLVDAGAVVRSWEGSELRGFSGTAELERALAAALSPADPGS
ncbi:MAG: ABC transporter ATP-binding protein [Pseudomonadota bacterium]